MLLKKILLFSFLIGASSVFAQESKLIRGIVFNDSINVHGVTITNINLKKSTKTNSLGFFELFVREKDSIKISAIHIKNKNLVVTSDFFKKGEIEIKIEELINEMDELILNQLINPAALDFSAAFKPSTKVDEESMRRMEITRLANTDPTRIFGSGGAAGGTGAFNITDPIFILIGKLAEKLKGKGLSKSEKKKRTKLFKLGFIEEYGESYFTDELKISKLEIDDFIKFCNKKKSLYSMYSRDEKLDLIDFLIKQSKAYKKKQI